MENNEEKVFNAILENFKKEYTIPKKIDAFNIFVPYQICKNKMIGVEEAMESCVDGGNDGGIDNIFIFVNDMLIKTKEDYEKLNITRNPQNILEIFIMQNKKTNGFSPDTLNKLYVTFQNIFDEKFNIEQLEKNYNFELIEQILLFRKIMDDIPNFYTDKISMNFIYSTVAKDINISQHVINSQKLLMELIKNNMCIDNVNIVYNGIKELKKLYDSGFSSCVQLKTKNMISDTYVDENNEACIVLSTIDDYYEFLSSEEDELKEYLFEANIRDFQEKNNDVNDEILRTLNERSNVDFWWLNNGITILVEPIRVFVELFENLDITKFEDYQKVSIEHKNLSRFKRNGLFLTKNIKKGNFLTYVDRAQKQYGNLGNFNNQVKNSWRYISKRLVKVKKTD